MSSNPIETHIDLIDFHVGSPVLPRRSSVSEINFGYDTENLIDTELPVFEQKLQTQSTIISSQSRRNSVDVEDILIKIDSDEFEKDSLDGEEVETDDFLDVCGGVTVDNDNTESTLPVDNFEALLVLKNLDDLLNATLEESENITNGNSIGQETNEGSEEIDEDTQYIIEECLGDLDNYLQAIDTCDTESNLSDGSIDQSSHDDDWQGYEQPEAEFNEELARSKLRQIEENYRKFVASGIVNRGYIDTENNGNFTLDDHLRRPSSACAIASQLLNRKPALKANTVNSTRKERPRLIRRKSLNENYIAPQPSTLTRTSGTDAAIATPEIARLSHDVSRERHAHASADCCTGTVIVEPMHRQCKAASSSTSEVFSETLPSEPCGTGRSPWLRSSMRRLQQLTLPNVDRSEVAVNADGGAEVSRLEVPDDTRPVSAPSRLPPFVTSTDRSSRSRSRNLVSQEPNGRARSSSASSRSRRQRSLSSSGTSVASSVDSTLSRMPHLEGPRNANNVESPTVNNNTQRRYVFLLTGIVYGAGKLKALRVYEESRTEEKARRKIERDARLVEEKRLAAEKDFQQIVDIFRPPPKAESPLHITETDIAETPVETSADLKLSEKGLTPECDSSYETIYSNDTSEFGNEHYGDDIYNKPLDLTGDDVPRVNGSDSGTNVEDQKFEQEDARYVIQDFSENLPVLPPAEDISRMPSEK